MSVHRPTTGNGLAPDNDVHIMFSRLFLRRAWHMPQLPCASVAFGLDDTSSTEPGSRLHQHAASEAEVEPESGTAGDADADVRPFAFQAAVGESMAPAAAWRGIKLPVLRARVKAEAVSLQAAIRAVRGTHKVWVRRRALLLLRLLRSQRRAVDVAVRSPQGRA